VRKLAALILLLPALALAQTYPSPRFKNVTTDSISISNSTGNITSPSGPSSASNTWYYQSGALLGTLGNSTAWNANYTAINDQLNTNSVGNGQTNFINTILNATTGFTGNRNLSTHLLQINATPAAGDTSSHSYTTDVSDMFPKVNVGGTDLNYVDALGSAWAINPNTLLFSGATNYIWTVGAEIDASLPTGTSSTNLYNVALVRLSTHAVAGALDDAFIVMANSGTAASNGIEFGKVNGGYPFGSGSSILRVTQPWAPTLASAPLADNFIDGRAATYTTGPIELPNSGIDASANVYGANLYSTAAIGAKTATLTSITINAFGGVTGGAFFASASFPTLTVDAPPTGSTATATVATMKLTKALLVAGTDSGCTNGDVLTLTGGAGSQATVTLTVVGGAATAVSITTVGSYTGVSAAPGTTGGTCSVQPAFNFGFGIATTTITGAGSGYPAFPAPLIRISGYNNSRNTTASLTAGMTTVAGSMTVSSPLKLIPGNFSATSWTTSGVGLTGSGSIFTDTTGSGTVATEAIYAFPPSTIAATNASVTITNLDTLFLPAPAAGTNVTATTLWSLHTAGKALFGGLAQGSAGFNFFGANSSLNNNSNFTTSINTGTSTGTITIGNAGNPGKTVLAGISTGTNATFLCGDATGIVLSQTSACTISSLRFKQNIGSFTDDALARILALPVDTFIMKPTEPPSTDPNSNSKQIGLIAEDIARIEPRCAIYEDDMKTPKSYRPECMIALLVAGTQQAQTQIARLQWQSYALALWSLLLTAGVLRRRKHG